MQMKFISRKHVTLLVMSLLLVSSSYQAKAQQGFVHESSTEYQWPEEKGVLKKLDAWQDQKFGVLFHWGLYSIPGIVESWSICSEDVDWISRKNGMPYDEYKKWYWGLKDSLNPVNFNPEQWAEVMQDAGIKYMIFTTKHHDGFCLWPSRYTTHTVAASSYREGKGDIVKEVSEACKRHGLDFGIYLSPWDRNNYLYGQGKPYDDYFVNQLTELSG